MYDLLSIRHIATVAKTVVRRALNSFVASSPTKTDVILELLVMIDDLPSLPVPAACIDFYPCRSCSCYYCTCPHRRTEGTTLVKP